MGIIHRDIKPENLIFLSETTYELKLADFGLAEFKGEKNPLFVRCGTPGYVAPEVLKDEPYTEKVDIFATGIILYILLTGCTPFFGETYNEIIDKNQDGRVNYNFEEIGITVSDEALNLLQQLLEIDPNQRISATQALQHEWILKHAPDDEVMVSPLLKKKKKNNLVQDNLKKLMMQNEQVSYKKRPSDIFINSPLRKQGTMDFDDSPTMEENQECASPLIKHNMKVLKKSDSYNKMKKQIRDLILDQQDIKKSFDEPDNLILQKPSTKKENIINLVKI